MKLWLWRLKAQHFLWGIFSYPLAFGEIMAEGFELLGKIIYRSMKLVRRGINIKESVRRTVTELDWELRAKHREEMMQNERIHDSVSSSMFSPEAVAWHIQNEYAKRGVVINLEQLTEVVRSEPMYSEAQRSKLNVYLEPYEEAARKLEQPPESDAS